VGIVDAVDLVTIDMEAFDAWLSRIGEQRHGAPDDWSPDLADRDWPERWHAETWPLGWMMLEDWHAWQAQS